MKLYELLKCQLKKENSLISDNGELKKWVVINKAQSFDAGLIGLLLEDKALEEKFFLDIKGVLVFNQNLFVHFLEQKNYLPDSYTQYKNKVGLTIAGKYLKQRNEVALVWPFKDCVLEGGQSREEDKKEEIFFNEILAQDEITQLLEPKILTNANTYQHDGQKPFEGFARDTHGTITDNLIIKGNNLLALHSLKKAFAGKVKLIYIDPPYNTGNDGFKYNDSFNHSTWLVFMKNRLEVARELLRKDGVMFVQCDDNEQAYLKVLMDEVFGRDNFVSNIVWKGRGGRQDSRYIAQVHEFLILYAKKKEALTVYKHIVNDEADYNLYDEERQLPYKLQLVRKWGSNSKREDRPNLYYSVRFEDKEIFPKLPNGDDGCWRWSKEKLEQAIKDNLIVSKVNKETDIIELYEKLYKTSDTKEIVHTSWLEDGFSGDGAKHNKELFQKTVFDYPKPEALLQRVLEIATKPGDIVLDYHLGSATTCAVAHKMNRQYIGIEQMDYIQTVSVERLRKVIAGEQGGISKSINWNGGGSFVYCELKKHNQDFIDRIEDAPDTEAILNIWEQMKEKSFLSYKVDIQKQDAHIEEFKQLALPQQKECLVALLDKNQLYVNLSSTDDEDFGITKEEKAISNDFYR